MLHSIQLHVDRSAKVGTLFAIASSPHHYESVVAFPLTFDGPAVKIVVCYWTTFLFHVNTVRRLVCTLHFYSTSTAVLSLSLFNVLLSDDDMLLLLIIYKFTRTVSLLTCIDVVVSILSLLLLTIGCSRRPNASARPIRSLCRRRI